MRAVYDPGPLGCPNSEAPPSLSPIAGEERTDYIPVQRLDKRPQTSSAGYPSRLPSLGGEVLISRHRPVVIVKCQNITACKDTPVV